MVEKHLETVIEPADAGFAQLPPRSGSEFRRIVKVFFGRKLALIGLVILAVLFITAIIAPWLAPYDPIHLDVSVQLQQPSLQHLLGTDSVGRDTLSRIIFGARTSLLVGFGAVGLGNLIGLPLGLIAGYFGGWVFMVIMRISDVLLAFPMLLSALIIAAVLGSGIFNVIVALAIVIMPRMVRLMCGETLSVKQRDFILAARSIGVKDLRTMLLHIAPNAFPPIMVMMTIDLGMCILMEASLSFLGVGIAPPTPAWGGMVSDGYQYLLANPILSFAPGAAIMLAVFGINMAGDGLRDAIDPRLRGII